MGKVKGLQDKASRLIEVERVQQSKPTSALRCTSALDGVATTTSGLSARCILEDDDWTSA